MYSAWLFFEDRFKDVYFPDQKNWTSQIALSQFDTGWNYDAIFPVREFEENVYITLPKSFHWPDDSTLKERKVPVDAYFRIRSDNGSTISVLFRRIQKDHLRFTKYRVRSKTITVGRAENTDIQDENGLMSALHGYLTYHSGNLIEFTDQSSNGSYLNGRKINKNTVRVQFGDVITFPTGLKLIVLGNRVAVNQSPDMRHIRLEKCPPQVISGEISDPKDLQSVYVQYHRAPRMLQKADTAEIEIEPPLSKQSTGMPPLWQQLGPSMTMVLPMLMGTVVMGRGGMSSGIIMVGTSSALAVMWALINRNYRKKQSNDAELNRIKLYQTYISEMENTLCEKNDREFQRLVNTYPNVGQCAALAGDTGHRLWDRMPSHPDFLSVRLGIGNVQLPNPIKTQKQKLSIIDDPLRNEPERLNSVYSVINNAPVTVSLRREAVVGILGMGEAVLFAQGLLMQIAALHSYHDVRIAVLTDRTEASQWAWSRWLPHVFANEDREMRMVVSTPSAIHDVMTHIDEVLTMRKNTGGENEDDDSGEKSASPLPHYIIFCTNSRLLENEPVMRKLLTNKLGMTLVMVAPSLEMLPKECHLVLNAAAKPGVLYTSEGDTRQLDFEYPSRNLLTSFAQQIAPLRVRDAAENAAIPTLVSFLDIYGVRRIEELDIWRMWSENKTYEGLRAVIGYRAGSQPFVLDISEKYHGPHGLVAGTTGSGKSVMLQTYILSLAANYSPEQVQFILIDYKGGGMADAFRDLPHVAGIIDNLQGSRVIDRALASLNGEIHRREVLFKAMGVKDITEYSKQYGDDPAEVKLPHLIIIADEFAELKSDQPEFMKELVSASRVGRSLGIHLILATQKPSASVSDEIWANSRFHLCLRVQTVADSRDMLKRPDAAYIKGTGRCFIQIGNDESFDQIQTSYSGLAYDPNVPRPEETPRLLGEVGQPITIPKKRSGKADDKKPVTQMDAVLTRIGQIASEHGMAHSRQMWLPEMPSHIYFNRMQMFCDNRVRGGKFANPEGVQFMLGLADDAAHQRYVPFAVNLTQMRNLMIVGLAGAGKTTAVQSIAYSLASQYDPAHLHMYILSLTSQTLGTLSRLPHVGDIAFENDTVEVKRFINMMFEEEERRSELFAKAATDSFVEYNRSQRAKGLKEEPAIVIFVDRYEQLKAMFDNDEATNSRVMSLIREGSGRGIHFIVTALAKNEVPYKLHSFFNGVALQLAERSDYSDVLGKRVPSDMPPIATFPGRAMGLIDGEPYEIQLALAGFEPLSPKVPVFTGLENPERYAIEAALPTGNTLTDVERAAQLTAFADAMAAAWKGERPVEIPRIPDEPTWQKFFTERGFAEAQKTPYDLPVGYDFTKGALKTIDLEDNFSMFVTGPKDSGKTNFLKLVARMFADRGAEVHIIGNPNWAPLAKSIGANLYTSRMEILEYVHKFQEGVFRDERKPLKAAAAAEGKAALRKQALEFKPYALIIDDAQRFNTDYNDAELGKDLKFLQAFLSQVVAGADHYNIFVFMAVSTANKAYFSQEPLKSLIAQRRGVAFGGKVTECDPLAISSTLPNLAARSKELDAGHGYLIVGKKMTQIVTPLAEDPDK